MRRKFRRSLSSAARWSPRFGGWAIFTLGLTILCHHFALITPQLFFVGVVAAGLMAMISFACAIKGFTDLWQRGDKGGRASIKGTILSFITLVPLCLAGAIWFILPPIYDISSDPINPPSELFLSELTDLRPENALPFIDDLSLQGEIQQRTWPNLRGRRYESSPDNILRAVDMVLEAQSWPKQTQMVDQKNGEILVAAVAYLPIFNFVSDVIIRLSNEDEATIVDMRVINRALTHDFGSGAYYITNFMQALDREVLFGKSGRNRED